ncbi:MAG: flippase-like domain-containing protein [Bacteroidia bacterium]|nr:flippase-like domain-containing protein [Bacteroidia bacterium]MCX7651604.1 flippase-like domain-containing protein [Bacteroidia bacterium]MDW8417311.1 lysylphosphatidylglycerol synthase transmembrane domain-containing protein [Bacteroidia bacterium]
MKRRILEALIGLALGVVLLWWVLRGFDWHALLHALQRSTHWLLLTGLFMTAAHLMRAWRWQLMLRSSSIEVDFAAPWWALMIGYLTNTALPRVGEVLRCTLLWRWRQVPFPTAFGTVVAERIIDLVTLLFLAIAVVIQEGVSWFNLLGWGDYVPYVIFGGILGLILGSLALRYVLRGRLAGWLSPVIQGFESLWRTRPLWLMLTLSVGIWAGYGGAIWGVMMACSPGDAGALIWASVILLVGSGLAMAIPVPGGIGTFHAIGLILLKASGWAESDAKLTVFTAHALQTLLILGLGMMGLLWSMRHHLHKSL